MLDEREPRIPQAARFLFGIAGIAVGVTLLLAWRTPDDGPPSAGASTGEETPTASAPLPTDDETATVVRPTESAGPIEGAVAEDEAGPIVADGSVSAAGVPGFSMPLAEWSYVTDRYGADRGIGFIHGGIDLAVEGLEKSPVYASCQGTVLASEYSGSYGNHVIVDCGDSWATLYAHLSSVEVAEGDEVTAETVLGRTGSSGFSTGEHLHFEIILDGKRVNPEHYLDFKIPPGTPLSSGPLYFPGWDEEGPPPTPTDTPTPTATPTDTPIPTATRPPAATETPTPVTPTPKPTNTPTATPEPPTPTATPTSPPIIPG